MNGPWGGHSYESYTSVFQECWQMVEEATILVENEVVVGVHYANFRNSNFYAQHHALPNAPDAPVTAVAPPP